MEAFGGGLVAKAARDRSSASDRVFPFPLPAISPFLRESLGVLVLVYWSVPILSFRPGELWPLGPLLSLPTVAPGEVSVFAAVFLLQQGVTQVLAACGTW